MTTPQFEKCPHCGQPGHWPAYEREQLAAHRCPWSGLVLGATEVAGGGTRFMCGVCDCFGYRPQDVNP